VGKARKWRARVECRGRELSFSVFIGEERGGQWSFSTEEAKKEILARRIDGNELNVLDVLNAMAGTQEEYFANMRSDF
jgi:hypothetical protein